MRRSLLRPRLVATALVLLATSTGLVAGCGDTDSGGGGGESGNGLRVSMTEFAYDPDPIPLPDSGILDVVNDGAVAHDLVIGELGKGTPELGPGKSMVLDLSDQPSGTYRVVCDLPGHIEAGMVTELIIE